MFFAFFQSTSDRLHIATIHSFLKCLVTFKPRLENVDLADSASHVCLSLAVEMVTMEPADDHMTELTNEIWSCLTQCLQTVPTFINSFLSKAIDVLQSEYVCKRFLIENCVYFCFKGICR